MADAFSLVDRQTLYRGKRVTLELHTFEDGDGQKRKKEVVVHPGAVVILPISADGRVVLIRNKRPSVGQVLLELPAGTLEAGELPINCAGRELLEETGYLAKKMQPLASFYTSPGILTEKMHAFLATGLVHQGQQLDEGEEIEVELLGYADAIEATHDGRIFDAKTISTLLLFDRFHHVKG